MALAAEQQKLDARARVVPALPLPSVSASAAACSAAAAAAYRDGLDTSRSTSSVSTVSSVSTDGSLSSRSTASHASLSSLSMPFSSREREEIKVAPLPAKQTTAHAHPHALKPLQPLLPLSFQQTRDHAPSVLGSPISPEPLPLLRAHAHVLHCKLT